MSTLQSLEERIQQLEKQINNIKFKNECEIKPFLKEYIGFKKVSDKIYQKDDFYYYIKKVDDQKVFKKKFNNIKDCEQYISQQKNYNQRKQYSKKIQHQGLEDDSEQDME